MVRTQLYLDEAIHRRLRELAVKQGRTVSDLVREALVRVYAPAEEDLRVATLEGLAGLWRDRKDVGKKGAYVRQLRRDTRRQRKR